MFALYIITLIVCVLGIGGSFGMMFQYRNSIKALAFLFMALCNCYGVYASFEGMLEVDKENHSKTPPTALDVYRGNTKLQITYIDSVAVDSIVVWKDEPISVLK